jgi:hypothetical protein
MLPRKATNDAPRNPTAVANSTSTAVIASKPILAETNGAPLPRVQTLDLGGAAQEAGAEDGPARSTKTSIGPARSNESIAGPARVDDMSHEDGPTLQPATPGDVQSPTYSASHEQHESSIH